MHKFRKYLVRYLLLSLLTVSGSLYAGNEGSTLDTKSNATIKWEEIKDSENNSQVQIAKVVGGWIIRTMHYREIGINHPYDLKRCKWFSTHNGDQMKCAFAVAYGVGLTFVSDPTHKNRPIGID